MKFLFIASFPDSILKFRESLIDALLSYQLSVHVAAPDLPTHNLIRKRLEAKGVVVHNIPLQRGMLLPNPAGSYSLLLKL